MFGLARFRITSPAAVPAEAPRKFQDAVLYDADDALQTALELALELGQPLLLTGEPGCGKTSAAYWAAWYLGLPPGDLHHTQIRSTASASDLKYDFDNIGYLRESQVAAARSQHWDAAQASEAKRRFIRKGPLWRAFEAARERSVVLLLDEIDKAPRDFPNDLLHEFDQLEFEVPEWRDGGPPLRVSARPVPDRARTDRFILVIFTSNGERRLPDAFLRRCVHHHVSFDEERMLTVVRHRAQLDPSYARLPDDFLAYAVKRFMIISTQAELNHRPGLAELLIWLRAMAMVGQLDIELFKSLSAAELPHLGLLIKDPQDRKRLEAMSR